MVVRDKDFRVMKIAYLPARRPNFDRRPVQMKVLLHRDDDQHNLARPLWHRSGG